jgi:hypothetical protein
MPSIDLSAYAGLLIIILLVGCFGTLFHMRDRDHAAPRLVSRFVWCPRHQRTVAVEFNERVQTGMASRTVQHCPLRAENERCGEGCAWEAAQPLPVGPSNP